MQNSDQQTLIAAANRIPIIFVDCFDTIISRSIDGQYLKQIWAKRFRIATSLGISSEDLFKLRVALEAELCEKNRANGFDLEFRFLEFVNSLYDHLNTTEYLAARISRHEFQSLALAVELKLETSHQTTNQGLISALSTLQSQGKLIYLVSDFYHGSRALKSILKHHSILTLFEDAFTSSDYLLTKRTGRLYSQLLEVLNLSAADILMIGDHPISDQETPRQLGIKTFPTPPPTNKVNADIVTIPYISSALSQIASQKPLFPELAFSLYLFCESLVREAINYRSNKLFFISREGIFLKRVFDHFQENLFGHQHFETSYFQASRKATFLPSLSPLESETFEVLFRQYRRISIEKFLINLNLEPIIGNELRARFGERYSAVFDDLPTAPEFKQLLSLPLFKEAYENERLAQREALSTYMESLGCNDRDILLVDVGWKGSIQDNLRKVISTDNRIIGLYLGLSINTSTTDSLKKGLLFDSPSPNDLTYVMTQFLPLFEILCGAGEGSTSKYTLKNDTPQTIQSSDEIEARVFAEIIAPAQEKLFQAFLKTCDALLNHHHDNFCECLRLISKHHARMIYLPNSAERTFIQAIEHLENFGVLEYTQFKTPPPSFIKSLASAAQFAINPRETLAKSSNPITRFDSLGLPWLGAAFGQAAIKRAFGDLSGLNITPSTSAGDLFCNWFCSANRAKSLGDYR